MTDKDFVRWLKDFLVDAEITEAQEKRIEFMLTKIERKEIIKVVKQESIKIVSIPVLPKPVNPKTLAEVMGEVQKETGVTRLMLRRHNRTERLVYARELFAMKALSETSASPGQIGEYINRDRSTILHYRKKLFYKSAHASDI